MTYSANESSETEVSLCASTSCPLRLRFHGRKQTLSASRCMRRTRMLPYPVRWFRGLPMLKVVDETQPIGLLPTQIQVPGEPKRSADPCIGTIHRFTQILHRSPCTGAASKKTRR